MLVFEPPAAETKTEATTADPAKENAAASNDSEDKTIPEGTLSELLARTDLTHVCFSAMLADKVPTLRPGDLVLYTTMPELAAANKSTVAGTVTAKVTPVYTSRGTWQVYSPEPKQPPVAAADPQ